MLKKYLSKEKPWESYKQTPQEKPRAEIRDSQRSICGLMPAFHFYQNIGTEMTFEDNISNFKKRLIDRGYSQTMIENPLSDIKFTERESALLKHNNKEEKEILPFVTQYQPSVSTLKEVLMKKWNLIQNQPLLRQIFKEPPIISCKKGKSLKDMLVRAKI